ncbi:MAG: hypothetical protein JRJ87_26540, partial [Deltaproteobacteria bacterium]|nr:hypothetical protein [Deltaproteobacteria bacterium]
MVVKAKIICANILLILGGSVLGLGCGGDSLLISLPDGNQVKYTGNKPSGANFSAACMTENVSVFADPEERSNMKIRCVAHAYDIKGNDVANEASLNIIAEPTEQGGSPQDGRDVTFTTTIGSFEPFGHSDTTPVKEKDFEIIGGIATATLYSFPGEEGSATVTANYITIGKVSLSESTTVIVKPAIGFMVESSCGMARTADRDTDDFVYTLTPSCDPKDVEPLNDEPNHMEQGIIHNPRDGLLTIVFYMLGEEGYEDSNSNGIHDPSEPFFGKDLAEPYVDVDDNRTFDVGEPYIDVDGNGEWSDANGRWDEDTTIWTKVHILFTGRPHESVDTSRFEPSGISIASGGSQTLTLYLMDINHNPLAVNDDNDRIEFDREGGADITSAKNINLEKTMGVEFTADGNIIVDSFNESRDYQVTLADNDPGNPESVTLTTLVKWTPGPDYDGYNS